MKSLLERYTRNIEIAITILIIIALLAAKIGIMVISFICFGIIVLLWLLLDGITCTWWVCPNCKKKLPMSHSSWRGGPNTMISVDKCPHCGADIPDD